MWKKRTSVGYFVVTFTLLLPVTAMPSHPHSAYEPDAVPWIGIALSGGGLRAAAFSHGVMLELRKLCLLKRQEDSTDSDDHNGHTTPARFSLHYLEDQEYSDDDRSSPCGRGGGASFLENARFLSGVSGGAITAAYYKTHPDRLVEFGQRLKDAQLKWKLFTLEKKTPIWRPLAMLVASALDTIFQTFKLPVLPIPEVEVAPFATMWLYDGLFESEQLGAIYNKLFLDGQRFGELEAQAKPAETLTGALFGGKPVKANGIGRANLLINATDIANGRVFTFDKETFACLGDVELFRTLDLATAVAASSSLPGVFSPMRLKSHLQATDTAHIPTNCPLILGDQIRSPILVDGGVSDNLGVTGLLRAIFERKNRDRFQEDDWTLANGHGLTVSSGEPTRTSLATAEVTDFPTAQKENPKSQKAFLLIVNAGVSATSSLPALAGHIDDSFDVLIRDRTDLSRLVAQRLLNNFGFGVVELNMRDLVKNSRVVTRIVEQSLAIQSKTNSMTDSISEVARAFDFTEMERKVLSDLNNVSLLPSKAEIETLVLAGRAVVAERSSTIKREYEELADKQYAASCDSIVNPDRHYCWPMEFETPHVVANKVGVLLDVLTKTSEHFSKKTTENRSLQLTQIRSQLWDLYANETRALDLLGIQKASADPNPFTFMKCRIKQDMIIASALRTGTPIDSVPACDPSEGEPEKPSSNPPATKLAGLLDDLPENPELTGYVFALLNPKSSPATIMREKTAIDSWAERFIRHLLTKPEAQAESPWYDYLLARFSMLLGKTSEGFHYLYRGATTFPDDFNFSFLLGYYSIHLNRDFHGGLGHLFQAREKAEAKKKQIDWLPDAVLKDKQVAQKRFSLAEEYFVLQYAKYVALSPSPVEGRSEFILGEDVDAWLNQNFPDGHGSNELSTLATFAEKSKEATVEAVKISCRSIQKRLDGLSFPIEIKKAIAAFLGHFALIIPECPPAGNGQPDGYALIAIDDLLRGSPCGDIQTDNLPPMSNGFRARLQVCQDFAKVRHQIRELLAHKTALRYARAQARKLYESGSVSAQKAKPFPYLWEKADVYGLIALVDAIQKECPQRTPDIRTALRLFHVARASIDQDDRLNQDDGNFVTGVKKRISRLVEVTEEFSCGRDLD
ncbi:MAG: patatin-like phospholipase family protein [Nitrospirales bacterium]|nr:patatin-like phospholipase family protein [Nitrospirales bacterium]